MRTWSYHLHQRFMFIDTFKKVNSVHNVIKYFLSTIIGTSDAVLIGAIIGAVVGAVVFILMVICSMRCLKSNPVEEQEGRTSEAGSVHPHSLDVEGDFLELPVDDQKILTNDKVDVEEVALSVLDCNSKEVSNLPL
jgi:hypothetical protein